MMIQLALTIGLLAQAPDSADVGTGSLESVRAEYQADAEKYEFFADAQQKRRLELIAKPVMRWSSLKDYSGDVFVWTDSGLPMVIGCMLSGPNGEKARGMSHEFHLVADQPIGATDISSRRRWQPAAGLKRSLVDGAPPPAASAAGRLTQMRQLSRTFAVHMEAVNGTWDLRLLPQPLLRYDNESFGVIDGALFAHVWTTGTDPEFILLLECRRTENGPAWHFAPMRFTNRALRVEHAGREVWNVAAHQEPAGPSDQLYTTGFVRTFSVSIPATPPAKTSATARDQD
jgi:hypothetical protein